MARRSRWFWKAASGPACIPIRSTFHRSIPWLHIYYASTGVNALGQLINDGQQISRQDALRLYTRDNGWFLRMEDRLGAIEPGKLADLVVLSDDYLTVTDEQLKRIRSVLTLVDGKIVYDAGVLK